MGGALFSQPWRPLPKQNDETINFLKSYTPQNNQTTHLRILLHGPVGAGKSSFINSVDSILRGRIAGRALAEGNAGASFTKKYKTYKIKQPEGFCSFVFNDIMGFEQNTNSGVHVNDVILALKGHVSEDYKFNPLSPLTEDSNDYNSEPTLDDKVHVLVSVVDISSGALNENLVKKMKEVRQAASEMGIPQIAILTKADKACPKVRGNIKNIYRSKYLKTKAEEFTESMGLSLNCIFFVQNYELKTTLDDDISAPVLCALNQIINYGEDYLNDLQADMKDRKRNTLNS